MNVIGIIHSQYWLQPNSEFTFVDHLALIKQHYCISKKVGIDGKWVSKHFRGHIGLHNYSFMLTMKYQAFKIMVEPKDENLVTKLWC
jgi:hypothetical protein